MGIENLWIRSESEVSDFGFESGYTLLILLYYIPSFRQFIASLIVDGEPAIVLSDGKIKFINSDSITFNYFDKIVVDKKLADGKGNFDGILRNFENE